MGLQIYNTLTRKKEVFKPIKKGHVGVYSCGPTVYWYQHIGNLKAYIFSDILKRVLIYNNYKVKHVMNVTDVGHLTSDADTGEDKIEKAAKKEGKKAEDIANFYLGAFKEDFKKLNIIGPDIWCKATEYIKEQIKLLKILEKKGFTYKTADGIYFDTSKFKDYGKLARLDIKGLQEGKRIDAKEKRNKTDFALWKFSEKPGVRQQEWNSPFGLGFPGWHLECSAMAMKTLGKTIDIHTGGIDHIPVHHTNEIAQSEVATGKKFVNYWMHENFLTSKGEKISKSKGGLYTISELEENGFKPLDYRYFLLTGHYRKRLDFSLEILKNAQNSYQRLKNIIIEIKDDKKINKKYLKEFENAINDDLDMPKALAVLWNLVRDKKAEGRLRTIKKMDMVFGIGLLKKEKGVTISKFTVELGIPKDSKFKITFKEWVNPSNEILSFTVQRQIAREEKNFDKADKLRDKIKNKGYNLKDTKSGTIIETTPE